MAVTNTTNYSLAKPDQGTTAWHTYVNGNMDTIDAALKTGTGASVLPKRDANGNISNIGYQVTLISTNTTLTPAQSGIISITTGASVITVTLPTAVGNTQLVYTIKKADSGAGTVTIATTSSQTIDGVATKTINNQYATITIASDGANWFVDVHNDLDKIGVATLTTTAQDLRSAINEIQQMPVDAMTRQAIINGNFDVAQRGTSFTNPFSGQAILDRWKTFFNSDAGTFPANIIHSQQILTSGDIQGAFSFYRISVDGSGASLGTNSSYDIRQSIERGTRYLCGAGKKITVSFWARSSIGGKRIGISMLQNYGTGGSPSAQEQITGAIFNLTSNWQKFAYTFTANTLVGKTFGTNNDDYIHIILPSVWGTTQATIRFGSGTAETFIGAGNIDIAQVGVNANDIAYPFQPRDIDDEMKKSLRFAWIPQLNSTFVRLTSYTTNSLVFIVPLPVRLRIDPFIKGTINTDMVVYNMASSAQTGFTAAAVLSSNGVSVTLTKTAHGLTDGYLEIKTTSGFEAEI